MNNKKKAKVLDRRAAVAGEIFVVGDPFLARVLIPDGEPGCCEVHPKTEGDSGQWFCITCCVPLQNNFDKDSHCTLRAPKKTALVGSDQLEPARHVLAWRSFISGKMEAP